MYLHFYPLDYIVGSYRLIGNLEVRDDGGQVWADTRTITCKKSGEFLTIRSNFRRFYSNFLNSDKMSKFQKISRNFWQSGNTVWPSTARAREVMHEGGSWFSTPPSVLFLYQTCSKTKGARLSYSNSFFYWFSLISLSSASHFLLLLSAIKYW